MKIFVADSFADAIQGNWTSLPISWSPAGNGVDEQARAPTEASSADICFNWEDPTIYADRRGGFHILMHGFSGAPTDFPAPSCRMDNATQRYPDLCQARGGHAFSPDARHWYISRSPAYMPTVRYENQAEPVLFRARERPKLIMSPETGEPTHLVTAVGDPHPGPCPRIGERNCCGAEMDHSFTLVQPLAA